MDIDDIENGSVKAKMPYKVKKLLATTMMNKKIRPTTITAAIPPTYINTTTLHHSFLSIGGLSQRNVLNPSKYR